STLESRDTGEVPCYPVKYETPPLTEKIDNPRNGVLTADDWLKIGVTIEKRLKIIERCRAFVENEEEGEIERKVPNIFRRRESVSCRATEAGLMANKAIDKLKCSFESGV
ncbi:uncharacterized protein LOC144344242, partial [Saccoglossus kowalevskii]